MITTYYRYLDLGNAEEYIAKAGYYVWFYLPGQTDPPQSTKTTGRPADAVAAVVASINASFAAGDALGIVVYDGDKDPVPPPPPPAWQGNLIAYLKEPKVDAFFIGVPRSTGVV